MKKGEFDEALLAATINNLKKDRQKSLESNEGRANWFVEAFINNVSWANEVGALDRMSKIAKQQVVDFANVNFKDNYALFINVRGKIRV